MSGELVIDQRELPRAMSHTSFFVSYVVEIGLRPEDCVGVLRARHARRPFLQWPGTRFVEGWRPDEQAFATHRGALARALHARVVTRVGGFCCPVPRARDSA